MKTEEAKQFPQSQLEIETMSPEEIESTNGGGVIIGETIMYWVIYGLGKAVKNTMDHMSQLPPESSGYAQTYKMGSF